MTTNLFFIANVKQLRTDGSFRILLPVFRISWGAGMLNSAVFNSFHSWVEFGTILEGLQNLGGGGLNPPRYATVHNTTKQGKEMEIVECNTDKYTEVRQNHESFYTVKKKKNTKKAHALGPEV